MPDKEDLDRAFPDAVSSNFPTLKRKIGEIIKKQPTSKDVFAQITSYVLALRSNSVDENIYTEPVPKKRKISNGEFTLSSGGPDEVILTIPDISFSLPQRKRFTLRLTRSAMEVVSKDGEVETSVDFKDIIYMVCLPVPDQTVKKWNFCIFPKDSEGFGDKTNDAIVWQALEALPKGISGIALEGQSLQTDFKALLIRILDDHVKMVKVVEPDANVFRSSIVKAHRKNEVNYHVGAHKGTKEGVLFFLGDAIIWAFKKPLHLFFFSSIDAVSYSGITQRTFNLNIKIQPSLGGDEIEFGMIDQASHPDVDAYIQKRSLQDASMAEERKARKVNVNGKRNGEDEESEEEGANIKSALAELVQGDGMNLDEDEDESDDEDYEAGSASDGGSVASDESSDDDDDVQKGSGEEEHDEEEEEEE